MCSRRPRLLDGLRQEADRLEVEELAVVFDDLLGEQSLDDPDRLVHPPASGLEWQLHRLPFLRQPAGADPELDAPARNRVKGGQRPSGYERVP